MLRTVALCTAMIAAACAPTAQDGVAAQTAQTMPRPPSRPEMVESLRADLKLDRHPSDGGGRAWLDLAEPNPARVGNSARFELVFEAGPLGIDRGGMIFLQVSPFWGWSTPQTESPQYPGFTEVETAAEGVRLDAATLGEQLLGITIEGRRLQPGERVRIAYGASELGVHVDRYAESASPFWISVDGDGDGIRKLIAESPTVDVVAGRAAGMILTLPSAAHPGDAVELVLAVVDVAGNHPVEFDGTVELSSSGDIDLPDDVTLAIDDDARAVVPLRVRQEGIYRIIARGPHGLEAESNPLVVTESSAPILWADLHGHSNFSDGTGTPKDYFRYARDVATLDVIALTDHDHYGMKFLSQEPEMWAEIKRQVEAFHQPGRFVTILGYEWTNWLHGHRHVLYFDDRGDVLSAIDPRYEHPDQLWAALRGSDSLTFAHHSAGGPIAIDWNIPPDPELEPVTEIVSVHGSSEAIDSPGLIYSSVEGNFVRDVLDHGYRLGFIGSGDSHDGHPGLAHLASPSGGLAAIIGADRSRLSVLEALRERRVYATNGPRIVLRTSLDGHRMGSTLASRDEDSELTVVVVSENALEAVDIVRSGEIVETVAGDEQRFLSFQRRLPAPAPGEYLYIRAVQVDGGSAWSSPFFFE